MRALRIIVGGTILACVVSIAQTTPYLGLPLEPKPIFLDCYQQAEWSGTEFIKTGRTICLGS